MTRISCSVMLCLAAACVPEATIGKDATSGAGGGTARGSSESAAGDVASPASSSATDAEAATSSASGETSSTLGTSVGQGSTGTEDLACPPHMPTDPCTECLFGSCCVEVEGCNAECACIQSCVDEGHTLGACEGTCGDDGGAFDSLHQCEQRMCAGVC